MRVRFLTGPAGSGKTFRCLAEIRAALRAAPEGPPLILLAPKQTTYQLERQLLAEPALPGYTRLHILSFERLARFVFDRLNRPAPAMLDEEGRLMVLRGLLARNRDNLHVFRASARLTGFAQQLSLALREMQRHQLDPAALRELAARPAVSPALASKLQDLAAVLEEYLAWLERHQLLDADCLLPAAAEALGNPPRPEFTAAPRRGNRARALRVDPQQFELPGLKTAAPEMASPLQLATEMWVDGFAEFSPQELELLSAVVARSGAATITFCVDGVDVPAASWLSSWSLPQKNFENCSQRLKAVVGAELVTEPLPRRAEASRFSRSPVLQHLERCWSAPEPYTGSLGAAKTTSMEQGRGTPGTPLTEPAPPEELPALRVFVCADPESEATLAAREVRRHVRAGGRYRDIAVLVRDLEPYYPALQRVFSRYEIPFFLDRRESVSHHPLAELTRSALRTVLSQWEPDDWFAALKTGLVPAAETEIDRLENEALARGWRGTAWHKPLVIPDDRELTAWFDELQRRLMPPFQKLALAMAVCQSRPTGVQLAQALRDFWQALGIEEKLRLWSETEPARPDFRLPGSVHTAVWEQMNGWLANVELAFPSEALPLREWLPVLEAGLANLTVGLIPPALDQVVVGAIDRSRNADHLLALVLGMNESVFPAKPHASALLTDADRLELEKQAVVLGSTARHQLARERFFAYLACTRARQRLVLTCALRDSRGAALNASAFLGHLRQIFPNLAFETVSGAPDWRQAEHMLELAGPLLRLQSGQDPRPPGPRQVPDPDPHAALPTPHSAFEALPAFNELVRKLRAFRAPGPEDALAPVLAERLYGPVLRTSVSRMEQFAACPFRFFIHSGLRAEERKRFELDIKEQGSFQHEVLARFHAELHAEGNRWRDISPAQARERVGRLARELRSTYRGGLLETSEQTRFQARLLEQSLQDFIETLVGWMQEQYRFDPAAVELAFGEPGGAPGWLLALEGGHSLELRGRIDRVDLVRDGNSAWCVVVDYKSSQKQLDRVLIANGLQLQLLAYLNVLRRWPAPRDPFGVARLEPAGVFYVSLRGRYGRELNRLDALADPVQARRAAYRHFGRFDEQLLPSLDARRGALEGDQFSYRLTKARKVRRNSFEALPRAEFLRLLDGVEAALKNMGNRIFSGDAAVSPYRKGASTACDLCAYHAICRIDPWTHRFRVLKEPVEN